jgi:hypothetical protein
MEVVATAGRRMETDPNVMSIERRYTCSTLYDFLAEPLGGDNIGYNIGGVQ